MSYTSRTARPVAPLREDFSAAVYAVTRRLRDWLAYRRTLRELNALSTHTLADLGLHRSEIRRVAIESVYGSRP